ncbi:bifunctional riboflavin kinase/FAD synthetase, partial [bacterium]|nr:bifunctional riboflavin kinase/FAD synthetase [bacterium]
MEICKDLLNLENTVVGLGFFDGVHLGHQELIKQLVFTAKENNLKSVLITFQKSPAEKFVDNVKYLTL